MKKAYPYLLFLVGILFGCNNEKVIEVPLPPFKSELFVECYIEAGQPYRLALYETVSYFELPPLPDIKNAFVTISHNGVTDTLKYAPYLDPITGKVYNYMADTTKKIIFDTGDYSLYIQDSTGRTITGITRFNSLVPIDNITFKFNPDSIAYAQTTFTDNLNTRDYYRYQITLDGWQGRARTDINFSDVTFQTASIQLGSNYNLDNHTPVIITLYHLQEDYYEFLISIDDAQNANGNPFAQPARIKSNVEGGVGIFTALSYDRRIMTVQP